VFCLVSSKCFVYQNASGLFLVIPGGYLADITAKKGKKFLKIIKNPSIFMLCNALGLEHYPTHFITTNDLCQLAVDQWWHGGFFFIFGEMTNRYSSNILGRSVDFCFVLGCMNMVTVLFHLYNHKLLFYLLKNIIGNSIKKLVKIQI